MGAGAFGTALAVSFSNFSKVVLFSAEKEHVDEMRRLRINEFLQSISVPEEVVIDISENVGNYNLNYILWCFPVAPSVGILESIASSIDSATCLIICSKGICHDGLLLDAFKKIVPRNEVGVMSGANLASDIAALKFFVSDIAFDEITISKKVCSDLSNPLAKLLPSSDTVGVQIAGAVKNIIAIACGIINGLNAGQNAFAAMLSMGLKEMCNIGLSAGGQEKTFYGIAGIGDLVLTASSDASRNMMFGKRIGVGEPVESVMQSLEATTEGIVCVDYVLKICNKKNINAPICSAVFDVIYKKASPTTILDVLVG
jgi:glycerol-3-phosphate dehydrogenase (NAD(P)+)